MEGDSDEGEEEDLDCGLELDAELDPLFDSNSVLDCDFDSNSAFDSNAEPDFESVSLGANRQRACAVIEAQKRTRIDVEPA